MLRRFIPVLVVACLSTSFLFAVFNISWHKVPQLVGLGDQFAAGPSDEEIKSGQNIRPDLRTRPKPFQDVSNGALGVTEAANGKSFAPSNLDSASPFTVGDVKPAGSNYTRSVVVAKMSTEDTDWLDEELSELMQLSLLSLAVYVVDDPSAEYHPPMNKGHESMVYLTHIIDHYDDLPDISIFIHAHRDAWHNNALQNNDMGRMLRQLSPERVTREGYMNLRCDWEPGCPNWLHPGAAERDWDKQEEWLMAEAWISLFPEDPIPTILAQPCCAQFAVSRARIQAVDHSRYIALRDWLITTKLSDTISGRIFEYIWQYIFTGTPIYCPSMSVCYCDGYGFCFGDQATFDRWHELHQEVDDLADEWEGLRAVSEEIALLREQSPTGQVPEEADLKVPQPGRETLLLTYVPQLREEMQQLENEARERGRDPRQRALEAGRPWKDDDGF